MKHRSDEELFNYVVAQLLQQGQRSEKFGMCSYRGDKGRKCAVGWLIPDRLYCEEIEGGVINPQALTTPKGLDKAYILQQILYESGISEDQHEMLEKLQRIHDHYFPSSWREQFMKYAISRGWEWRFHLSDNERCSECKGLGLIYNQLHGWTHSSICSACDGSGKNRSQS